MTNLKLNVLPDSLRADTRCTDVMIDLETWGLHPGCAIRSIGAVAFNLETATTGSTFYVNVDQASCLALDMFIDPGTEAWWAKQSSEAQQAFKDPKPVVLMSALIQLADWLNRSTAAGTVRVWSHGAGFDLPILRDAGRRIFIEIPWRYQNERDTRTLFQVAQKADPTFFREHIASFSRGLAHHALDDSLTQVSQVCMSWALIRGENKGIGE